jgi:hypothetical protein
VAAGGSRREVNEGQEQQWNGTVTTRGRRKAGLDSPPVRVMTVSVTDYLLYWKGNTDEAGEDSPPTQHLVSEGTVSGRREGKDNE